MAEGRLARLRCTTARHFSRGARKMVRAAGVEPTTFGFGDRRSIQLSYARRVLILTVNANAYHTRQAKSGASKSGGGLNREWTRINANDNLLPWMVGLPLSDSRQFAFIRGSSGGGASGDFGCKSRGMILMSFQTRNLICILELITTRSTGCSPTAAPAKIPKLCGKKMPL